MLKFDDKINFYDRGNDVLTAGELLIDMISSEYGDDFECNTYNKFFGGSPANIAMNVKKLGINSIIASAIGNDSLGKFLLNRITASGIATDCIQQVEHSTSMVLVTKSKGTPVPIFYRDADFHMLYTKEIEEVAKNSKIVHFSCWPISRMPAKNTIEKLIKVAKENGTLVCFDPNYHPMIWEKGENGVECVKSIISKVDIVKPSEDDAERLFGKDTHEKQIAKFLNLGAKLVVMTLGSEGAIVSNGEETIKFDTMASEIVDTTGAGDAFWSGFYASIVKGYTIRQALNLGFAVSAYKLKHLGAVVELPALEEIKEIYKL